jgi:hypothetical protein
LPRSTDRRTSSGCTTRATGIEGSSPTRSAATPPRSAATKTAAIAPSADAIIRLAQAFDVSCDYLLVDDAPRRPFRSAEDALGDRLATLAELGDHDRELVLSFIDALVTKTRLKTLAGGLN